MDCELNRGGSFARLKQREDGESRSRIYERSGCAAVHDPKVLSQFVTNGEISCGLAPLNFAYFNSYEPRKGNALEGFLYATQFFWGKALFIHER